MLVQVWQRDDGWRAVLLNVAKPLTFGALRETKAEAAAAFAEELDALADRCREIERKAIDAGTAALAAQVANAEALAGAGGKVTT
jgi:hypothetical protein